MLKLLETIKDSAESTFDSAALRVENVHRLIGGYFGRQTRRLRGRGDHPDDLNGGDARAAAPGSTTGEHTSIYDVIRGVNREVGEFGTDVFEIIDDARTRREIEKRGDKKDPER